MKTTTGIKTDEKNGLIIVYSDKYNEAKPFRFKIRDELHKHLQKMSKVETIIKKAIVLIIIIIGVLCLNHLLE
jgi:NADH:ubiquinone oxidoreductase subunit D